MVRDCLSIRMKTFFVLPGSFASDRRNGGVYRLRPRNISSRMKITCRSHEFFFFLHLSRQTTSRRSRTDAKFC
jgi:hypothetical protein